jgi:cyd operon protein YbgT
MWYFSWVLGLGVACSFAILNAMVRGHGRRSPDDDSLFVIPRQVEASGRAAIMWPWIPAFAGMTMWGKLNPIGDGQR